MTYQEQYQEVLGGLEGVFRRSEHMLTGFLVLETSKGKGDKGNPWEGFNIGWILASKDSRSWLFPSAVFTAVFILPDVQEFEC